MTSRVKKHWEAEEVGLSSATVPELIVELRPGQAVTIKHTGTSDKYIMIGPDRNVDTAHGYNLEAGETASFALSANENKKAVLEIWGLPEVAADTVNYFKIEGVSPEVEAT